MAATLVTLAQAKAHCEVDHAIDDALIQAKLDAAEAYVLDYLDDGVADEFTDTSGAFLGDPPPQVIEAILQLCGYLYRHRDDPNPDGRLRYGFAPESVTWILHRLRDPALA